MRGIGLIIAGSLAAACDGPGTETPDVVTQQQEETAASNEAMAAAPVAHGPDTEATNATGTAAADSASACSMQGADRLQVAPIRAVGTEPFWGARVDGRCVTYSTPENQQGTRVWTRYAAAGNGQVSWTGRLDDKPFEMRVRTEANCSDGMSDKSYPLAVELTVGGEQRKGCAEPL